MDVLAGLSFIFIDPYIMKDWCQTTGSQWMTCVDRSADLSSMEISAENSLNLHVRLGQKQLCETGESSYDLFYFNYMFVSRGDNEIIGVIIIAFVNPTANTFNIYTVVSCS